MSNYGRAYATINATNILSCRQRSIDRRIRPFSAGLDGTLHQTMHAGIRTAPMASLTTADLGGLLGLLNNAECPMVNLSGNGLELLWPKGNDNAPGDASGSVHHKEAIALGQVYLDGISWSAGDIAEAAATCLGISANGTSDPVATSNVSAAPAAQFPTVAYVLNTFTVNSVAVGQCRRFELRIAHGARNDDEGACYLNGKPHPTAILTPGAGGQIAYELTFDMHDLAGTIALGNIVATFTVLAPGAVGLGGTTKTLTMVPGMIIETTIADGNPSTRSFRCLLKHDGTNRSLTVS